MQYEIWFNENKNDSTALFALMWKFYPVSSVLIHAKCSSDHENFQRPTRTDSGSGHVVSTVSYIRTLFDQCMGSAMSLSSVEVKETRPAGYDVTA